MTWKFLPLPLYNLHRFPMALSPITLTDGSIKAATYVEAAVNLSAFLYKAKLAAVANGVAGIDDESIKFAPVAGDGGKMNIAISGKIPYTSAYVNGAWVETDKDPLAGQYAWDAGTGDFSAANNGFVALKMVADHIAKAERQIQETDIFKRINTVSITRSDDGLATVFTLNLPASIVIDDTTSKPTFEAVDFLDVVDKNFPVA
jgi:hypothetical protein